MSESVSQEKRTPAAISYAYFGDYKGQDLGKCPICSKPVFSYRDSLSVFYDNPEHPGVRDVEWYHAKCYEKKYGIDWSTVSCHVDDDKDPRKKKLSVLEKCREIEAAAAAKGLNWAHKTCGTCQGFQKGACRVMVPDEYDKRKQKPDVLHNCGRHLDIDDPKPSGPCRLCHKTNSNPGHDGPILTCTGDKPARWQGREVLSPNLVCTEGCFVPQIGVPEQAPFDWQPKERKRVSKASTDPAAELRKAVLQAVVAEPGMCLVDICKRIKNPTLSIPCRVDELVQTGEIERRTEDGKGNVGYYYYRNTAREVQPVTKPRAPNKVKHPCVICGKPVLMGSDDPAKAGSGFGGPDCPSAAGPDREWMVHHRCDKANPGLSWSLASERSVDYLIARESKEYQDLPEYSLKQPSNVDDAVWMLWVHPISHNIAWALNWGAFSILAQVRRWEIEEWMQKSIQTTVPADEVGYTARDPGFARELLTISEEQWYPPVGVCWACKERVYPGEEAGDYRVNGNTMKASDGRVFHDSCFDKWGAENKAVTENKPVEVTPMRIVCAMVDKEQECVHSSLHANGHFICSTLEKCKGPYPVDKYQVVDGVLVLLAPAAEVLEQVPLARETVQATLNDWIPRMHKPDADPELPKHRRRDAGMSQRERYRRELRSGILA